MVLTAAALSSLGGVGCSSAPGVARDASDPIQTTLIATGDEPLELSVNAPCKATGLEICFNATDDDCNGLWDEGCGIANGLMQIVIAWDVADADVNLVVIDPKGETAEVGQITTLGLTKDRDCPGRDDVCAGQNFEVVSLAGGGLAPGRYGLRIVLARAGRGRAGVNVWIGGHLGQDTLLGHGELSTLKPRRSADLSVQARSVGRAR